MQMTFVLGVHRSGTSLLTGGLQHAGVPLGQFDNRTNVDNPRGEFEHDRIVAFNDRLLAACGASWDNWGFDATARDWDAAAMAPWRAEAADLLGACFGGLGRAAVKDPRLATLLPFWRRVLDDLGWTPRHLLVVRPPADVARSQVQRAARRPAGFPVIADAESMCALWAVTMHAVLSDPGSGPVLVLRHDTLYAAPQDTLRACAAHLGMMADAGGLDAFADRHLDPALRRADGGGGAQGRGPWQTIAQRLYDAVRPPDGPVPRDADWGRQVLEAHPDLRAALPLLGAVHRSIGTLRARFDAAEGVIGNAALQDPSTSDTSDAARGGRAARPGRLLSRLRARIRRG